MNTQMHCSLAYQLTMQMHTLSKQQYAHTKHGQIEGLTFAQILYQGTDFM
jgi:hypothetical protein